MSEARPTGVIVALLQDLMAEATYDAHELAAEIGLTEVMDRVMLERAMQIEKDFTAEHDDRHTEGELAKGAICYAQVALQRETRTGLKMPFFFMPHAWPWDLASFHPDEDAVVNLVKGAAMLIAEAERIERKRGKSDAAQRVPTLEGASEL